jgi:hypothetical protein
VRRHWESRQDATRRPHQPSRGAADRHPARRRTGRQPCGSPSIEQGFPFIFPSLAQQYQIALVPFLLNGVVLTPDLLGADGVHPNAAGAERIADTVWP